jgi:hypothetical protein
MARIRSSIPRRVIPAHITLTVVEAVNLLAASILVLLFLGGFLTLAWKSNIIRDASPPSPPPGARKPYSLQSLLAKF